MTEKIRAWFELPIDREELIRGGVPDEDVPSQPHITVLYIGEVSERNCDKIADVIASTRRHIETIPETVTASGYGAFIVEGTKVPVLLIDSPYLEGLRRACVLSVNEFRIPRDMTFGFQPHVALKEAVKLETPIKLSVPKLCFVMKAKDEDPVWIDVYEVTP